MNERSKPHKDILQLINPPSWRRVLVVEGADDKGFIERQLDVAHTGWRSDWVVGVATGKSRVLDILKLEPTWLGVVDGDEWDSTMVDQVRASTPALHVLQRYCMESYFVQPREVWALLPAVQQGLVAGGYAAFEAALQAPLASWVRHGVLWRVVNPLWAGLKAKGFKDALLDFTAAQDDDGIKEKLQEWDAYLDATTLYDDFQSRLTTALALDSTQQLGTIVHGKSFFRAHVSVTLNQFLKPLKAEPAEYWLTELTKSIPAHADFAPLWAAMNL
ncbi:MAG: hypothetical protein NTX27_01975 [Verrucomicrobia bacterium]|nr:hypothetical protein [Verrucomicrobiota bacterium]